MTVRELALDVADVFGLDLSEAESQVGEFCAQLSELGAVVEADEAPEVTG